MAGPSLSQEHVSTGRREHDHEDRIKGKVGVQPVGQPQVAQSKAPSPP